MLVISLPPARRLKGLAMVPVALGVVFVAAPGLIGTLVSFFLAGNSDPSIAHRTNNYPYVEQLVRQAPWLGQGGNTYIPTTLHILDNQYLTTAIELGLLGLAALVFYLAWPAVVALAARRRTADPELRDLCAALAGADLAAVLCAATFDGFSFPMFFNLQALIAGLVGAVWMMASKEDVYEGVPERRKLMDLFAIGGTLWRHKRVSIPLVLLTVFGMLYVLAIKVPTYQAKANLLLVNPPAPPTAVQIAQDPSLARVNNPYANLGNLVYVADVLTEAVAAPAAKQALVQAGVSGYQIAVDDSDQTEIPPAIDVTGTGRSAQAAIQSAQLVASAISRELHQLQADQHVQSKFMITTVEYVTPTSATKSSSGKLQTAIGIAAIGLILLLVAVSAAQGLEERKNGRSRHGRQPAYHVDGRREPAGSPADVPYEESRVTYGESRVPYGESGARAAARMGESQSASPVRRPGMQPAGGSYSPGDQIG